VKRLLYVAIWAIALMLVAVGHWFFQLGIGRSLGIVLAAFLINGALLAMGPRSHK
jgi:hypothetical protein